MLTLLANLAALPGRVKRGDEPVVAASAASLAAALSLKRAGRIRPTDLVICVVTGHGLKQPDPAGERAEPVISVGPSLGDLEPHLRRWT